MTALRRFGLVVVCVMGLLSFGLLANDVSFTARVDRATISQEDTLVLDIVISGSVDRSAQLTLPVLNGLFQIVSQSQQNSYSFINGQSSSSQMKRLVLLPLKVGTLTIPEATLVSNGTTYKTQPIVVTVKKGSGTKPQASSSGAFAQSQDAVFLNPSVSKTEAYVGEEIVYQISFCRRVQLWGSISYQPPNFKGFWLENLKTKTDEIVKDSSQGRYAERELISRSLFPLNPGTATISEAKASFVLSPFEGERMVQSKPILIKVKPLPLTGKPSDFSGLVGDFKMTMSSLPSVITQNQPVTVRLDVSGQGGLTRLSDLQVEDNSQFKWFKSKTQDAIQFSGGVSGKRTFEYVVIPKVSGSLTFPKFTLTFFSPKTVSYKTISLGGQPLSVRPSLQSSEGVLPVATGGSVMQEDIRYLHPVGDTVPMTRRIAWAWGVLNGVLLVGLGVGAGLRRFVFKNEEDVAYRLAYRRLSMRLKALEKPGVSHPFSALEHALIEFLSDRTRTPLTGYTTERLAQFLHEKQAPQALIQSVVAFLERVQAAGYAPPGSEVNIGSLANELRHIVSGFKGGAF